MNNQPNYDMAMGFLQIFDVLLNLNQVSNDTLLEELQKQNKEYLEKIVKQNEKIIEQNDEIINYCEYMFGMLSGKINDLDKRLERSTKDGSK